jgi:delta 1-pyrroline-5-carboxylate dehydrogenase
MLIVAEKYKLPEEKVEDDAKVSIVSYEPLGVVAAICPWNCMLPPAIFHRRVVSNFFFHMTVPLMLGKYGDDLGC